MPKIQNVPNQPNYAVEQEGNHGEYSSWPNNSAPKADPSYADNGLLRGAPELPAILPNSAPDGLDSPAALPSRAMVSGENNPQGIENSPRVTNTPPLYYPPRSTAPDTANDNRNAYQNAQNNRDVYQNNRDVSQENRGVYQADTRADYRRAYDYTPNYRVNPAPTGQNLPLYRENSAGGQYLPQGGQNPATYGQNPSPYGQGPSPYGQNSSPYAQTSPYGQNPSPYAQTSPYGQNPSPYGQVPPAGGRGGAMQPQTPPAYNPNQAAPQAYPTTLPASAAGAGAYDAYPRTSASGTNPNTGNPDGFSYPVTENPPARKPYERPRPSIY
jgi:hypothetical protein